MWIPRYHTGLGQIPFLPSSFNDRPNGMDWYEFDRWGVKMKVRHDKIESDSYG